MERMRLGMWTTKTASRWERVPKPLWALAIGEELPTTSGRTFISASRQQLPKGVDTNRDTGSAFLALGNKTPCCLTSRFSRGGWKVDQCTEEPQLLPIQEIGVFAQDNGLARRRKLNCSLRSPSQTTRDGELP
mmetsp:Transcript_2208/g.6286  ORF Transcript_2208/g.6286 Transcript_2208/m.6286 type:complete len:133 (-) Transcript_2208:271-669(-)